MLSLASGLALLTFGLAGRASAKDPVVYTYDDLGRLISAAYPNGVTIIYTYDAAGNRTQVAAASTPPPPPPPPPPPLSASVTPTSISGTGYGPSAQAYVTASGGTAPYTYLWERTGGSALIVPTSITAANTAFEWTGSLSTPPKFANWRCKVTDGAAAVAYTGTVTVGWNPGG